MDNNGNIIKIKLIRSLIGSKSGQISTAHSLGLKRIGDTTCQPDNAATKGKLAKIRHLVVTALNDGELK